MIEKITRIQLVIILFLWLCPTRAVGVEPVEKGNFIAHIDFIVEIGALSVRQCPGTSCKILGSVKKGRKLYVMGIEGNWLKISFNNKTGYVSRKYVSMNKRAKKRTGKQAKRQITQNPPSLIVNLAKILPLNSLATWVIILSLAVGLYFLFHYFKRLDSKFINLLDSTKDENGGFGWPLIAAALAGILLAAAMLDDGISSMISIVVLIAIMTLLGVAVESVKRLGPKFAALRFLILAVICFITSFVAFYMTILLAFIIIVIIIIGLCIAGILLASMGRRRRVTIYYD
ncbi:MAG: SH3 domain-containing protein [bacterium]|nr:SH3 domain-containing protein [bacterium]